MELSRDFSDLLRAFSNEGVDYLIVGAHAMGVHGRARATKDLDVWVRPTADNARRVWRALAFFGAPMENIAIDDFVDRETIVQIGVAPLRIDVMTSISGVTFDEAWNNRVLIGRDELAVPFIGVDEFLKNKDAAGRDQDRVDAAIVRRRLDRA